MASSANPLRNYTLFEKIILGNVVFGSSYKLGILWNATVEATVDDPNANPNALYKQKRIVRPMLMGEKIAAFLWGSAMSPVLAPLWLCNQLNYLDIYMQGKKPKDLGYVTDRRSLLDYVFM